MLAGVAFCPHPPVLIPAVAQGAAAELDDLRAACRTALLRVAGSVDERLPTRIAVLGAGPHSRAHDAADTGSFAGFGVPYPVSLDGRSAGEPCLPLSLSVGAWLVADALGPQPDAMAFAVGPDWAGSAAEMACTGFVEDGHVVVVAMGDGSARRSTAAPGYFDPRAEDFDAGLSAALRSGEGDRLRDLAPDDLATELLATAPRVWAELAPHTRAAPWHAELLYDAAPYGVGYFVAAWTPRARTPRA